MHGARLQVHTEGIASHFGRRAKARIHHIDAVVDVEGIDHVDDIHNTVDVGSLAEVIAHIWRPRIAFVIERICDTSVRPSSEVVAEDKRSRATCHYTHR
jgi:hypothetical protein